MAILKTYKETALPATLEANAIYFIAPTNAATDYIECYVTGTNATAVRHMPTKQEIQALINTAITANNELTIVADITARDALAPTRTMAVYVQNATGDNTVSTGGAYYLYNTASSTWIKTAEAESMDVVTTWSSIQGKPNSSPTQIDQAVSAMHSHSNKTQLDKIGEDAVGQLTYGNNPVATQWTSTGW